MKENNVHLTIQKGRRVKRGLDSRTKSDPGTKLNAKILDE